MIEVTDEDVVTVLGLDPPPAPVEPLTVVENGTYTADPPLSGFNPVIVSVESGIEFPAYTCYSGNASSIVSIEHELSPGDYTVAVAVTNSLAMASVSVLAESAPIQLTELVVTGQGQLRGLAYANISVNEASTLTLLTTATASNSGVQMIVFSGEYSVEYIGSAGNDGGTYPIGEGLLFTSYKWGYYESNNPAPTTALCVVSGELISPPTPNQSTYWYGGTYTIKLIKEGE